jgi:radical SAM superfamily enzyme YgiQ (UPF0313 family)
MTTMKTLLFKIRKYIAEENRFGFRDWAEMPSNIATTAAYLAQDGLDVAMRDDETYEDSVFGGYDVAAAWVSIADGLYEGLDYLRVAKRKGCRTVLVLFDDWSGMQEAILRDYPDVDFGIRRWDVEVTLSKLLGWMRDGGAFDPRGIVYRKDGAVVDGGEVIHRLEDLHHLGSARKWLEQLNPASYAEFAVRVSSGCPFKCTFCHIRDRANRFRRVDDVLDELECVPAGSFVRILSSDLLQDKEWCRAFAEGIVRRGIDIRWETDSRFTWLKDMELLQLLRKSGCYELAMGLESYHPEMLKAIKKGYKLEQIDQGIENLLKVGIVPGLNMMIGHPSESLETLQATESFLRRISPKQVKLIGVQYLRPLPGTPVSSEIEKLGMLEKPLTYRDFFKSRDEPVLPTNHLSIPQIVEWRRRLVEAYQA